MLTTKELADRINVSVDTVRRLRRKGVISSVEGSMQPYRFKQSEVQWLIDAIDNSYSVSEYAKEKGYTNNTVSTYMSRGLVEIIEIPYMTQRIKRG